MEHWLNMGLVPEIILFRFVKPAKCISIFPCVPTEYEDLREVGLKSRLYIHKRFM